MSCLLSNWLGRDLTPLKLFYFDTCSYKISDENIFLAASTNWRRILAPWSVNDFFSSVEIKDFVLWLLQKSH